MIGKLKTLNEAEENDWWTSHDRKWAYNSKTGELIKFPDFQFPGRKELEERDAGSRT
jgi:hypothetical protein|nr:MAG TPA: hypothetical protein [Caudoviricetes sp.]